MKQTIIQRLRSAISGLIILVQIFFYPAAAFAQESDPTDVPPTESETSQPAEDTSATESNGSQEPTGPSEPTGPQQPTGAASDTYVYNDVTKLWENDYYTWNPVTGQTKPKTAQPYSYNPSTGMWDTTEYYFSPETGRYEANIISAVQNPTTGSAGNVTIGNTGPNSNNAIDAGGSSNGNFDLFFDASISNKIGQITQSGNASVLGNTLGGDALSGDATSIANVLSILQSSWGSLGSADLAYFMANIDGDITGDLYVDPSALTAGSGNTNIDVTVSEDAAIRNDIDVAVASGNATVSNNTEGGNATTGNAQAVVNLMNLINSAINANKSFVGVLNINGNFNGDILLPPEMMQAIIAATGPSSNNQINGSGNTTLNANIEDNKTIKNNVNANASTGSATISNNTNAGNATSGNASSNVVLLNLTGKKVVAENALLVFVNVLGSWVGLIYDAPAGTNAVATTGPGSNNTINENHDLTVDVDATSNSLIDNDVDVAAISGDAAVTGNTSAGDATSGDASVGVNILNMVDSDFQINDWFGVLFINVFGSWVGSFGVNTEAGNQPVAVGGIGGSNVESSTTSTVSSPSQTFQFVPAATSSAQSDAGTVAAATTPPFSDISSNAAPASDNATNSGTTSTAPSSGTVWIAGIATFIGALMLGGERLISMIRNRQVA